MSTPHDPFALSFDSIELDPTRAPKRDAIDRAMAHVASATPHGPGFYLLDDAGGRFSVDRDTGIIALLDEELLVTERNAVHAARLHVVEPSGKSYDLDLKLRLTGRIPQMVGAEDILGGFDTLAPPRRVIALAPEPMVEPKAPTPTPSPPAVAWTAYLVAAGGRAQSLDADHAPYGAVLDRPALPGARGPFQLHLFTPLPATSARDAAWSI